MSPAIYYVLRWGSASRPGTASPHPPPNFQGGNSRRYLHIHVCDPLCVDVKTRCPEQCTVVAYPLPLFAPFSCALPALPFVLRRSLCRQGRSIAVQTHRPPTQDSRIVCNPSSTVRRLRPPFTALYNRPQRPTSPEQPIVCSPRTGPRTWSVTLGGLSRPSGAHSPPVPTHCAPPPPTPYPHPLATHNVCSRTSVGFVTVAVQRV